MKIYHKFLCCAVILFILSISLTCSSADHPDNIYWTKGFPICGIDERVHALTTYNGKLVAGGVFEAAGDTVAHNLAAWDGNSWVPIATNFEQDTINPRVYALCVYDGKLIVGGIFKSVDGIPANSIAAWNGSEWDSLDSGIYGTVYDLATYDGKLIAGGSISEAGDLIVEGIASWNGGEWDSLGSVQVAYVWALTEYDGKLIVGGVREAGGLNVNRIASWDGSEWDSLGSGVDEQIFALTVYDNQLIAGGQFTTAGGNPASHIASWNGSSWAPVGGGTSGYVSALSVYDNNLIAMGGFHSAGGVSVNHIASWNGVSWDSLGSGLDYSPGDFSEFFNYEGKLIAGGIFYHAGGVPARNIAAWDGSSWSSLGQGWGGQIFALMPYFNLLVAGGRFDTIGGVAANNIAAWNGSTWISLGSGVNGKVNALTVCNYKLIAGGDFTSAGDVPANYIASWDYASWSALEGVFAPNAEVTAVGCYNNKVAAGSANGIIYTWTDGWPYWEQIGGIDPIDGWLWEIADFTVYNDCLIVAGSFTRVNAVNAYCIAAWDGSEWLNIGTAFMWTKALEVYDNKLYAGGAYGYLRCWDGDTWTTLGSWSGDYQLVSALTVFNDELIVAGQIYPDEGGPGKNIAAWNGTNWGCLGSGLNRWVEALAAYDDKLYAAGRLTIAGGKVSAYFAEWTKSDPVVGLASPEIKSSALTLYQNVPNPFNPSTRITFILPEPSRATLSIFNIEGKLVVNLLDEVLDEGNKQVTWDGKNAQGNPVSSGVYFYRLKAGGKVLTKKMVLLK